MLMEKGFDESQVCGLVARKNDHLMNYNVNL